MNKIKYETPNFDFQDMKLGENIADKCWGTNTCFFECPYPEDQKDGWNHIITLKDAGCNGQADNKLKDRITDIDNVCGMTFQELVDLNDGKTYDNGKDCFKVNVSKNGFTVAS